MPFVLLCAKVPLKGGVLQPLNHVNDNLINITIRS